MPSRGLGTQRRGSSEAGPRVVDVLLRGPGRRPSIPRCPTANRRSPRLGRRFVPRGAGARLPHRGARAGRCCSRGVAGTGRQSRARALRGDRISPRPIVVHGDPLPANVILQDDSWVLIHWDEARASWWPYELARLSYYETDPRVLDVFMECCPQRSLRRADVVRIVAIEHARQRLRQLFQLGFSDAPLPQLVERAVPHVRRIERLLLANEGLGDAGRARAPGCARWAGLPPLEPPGAVDRLRSRSGFVLRLIPSRQNGSVRWVEWCGGSR